MLIVRDVGVKYCYGKFFFFLDVDDYIIFDVIEFLVNSYNVNSVEMVMVVLVYDYFGRLIFLFFEYL